MSSLNDGITRATGMRIVGERASVCGHGKVCASALSWFWCSCARCRMWLGRCPSGSHFCDDGCDASYWYTPKAHQIAPTSVAMNMLFLWEFHHESRGYFARRGCLCRLCEDGFDIRCWSLVGYSLKALQIVIGPIGISFYLVATSLWVRSRRVSLHFLLQYIVSPLFLAEWLSVFMIVATCSWLCGLSHVVVS